MEAGSGGYFFSLIDNKARSEALDIVRGAQDAAALLTAASQHFDESVETLTAERILEEFADERLYSGLQNLEGFDPVLFKATLLFELSHLDEDESEIPGLVQGMKQFWTTAHDASEEDLERDFTAHTIKSGYRPFPFISHLIALQLLSIHASEKIQERKKPTPEIPDVQRQLDGGTFRIFMGDREIAFIEHPVLTRQLLRDLGSSVH